MVLAGNSSERGSALAIRWLDHFVPAFVIAGLLVSVAAGKYGGGSGTVEDPYLIGTAEDLDLLGSSQGDWDKSFRLVADIDLKDYDEKNLHLIGYWAAWGDLTNRPFSGAFDGAGHTISNFHYRDMQASGIGLFRYVHAGEVKNLHLENVKIVTGGDHIGSLVGSLGSGGVSNCQVTGADVTGNDQVGGLIGSADGFVSRCSSRGRVAGVLRVGGLLGEADLGTVQRSYSRASVSGTDSVGGLAGTVLQTTSLIDGCYATGRVEGASYAGGLVGQLVSGKVYKSYSAGPVTGSQAVGGLVGTTRALGEVIMSYWDSQASGCATSAGGMARTTAEMWSADTFIGWDFDTVWAICEGRSYPIFWWQVPTADVRCPDGVNWIDFVRFSMQWEHNDCGAVNWNCDWADFDESGDVGFPDLAILAEEWLEGTY
jgi:hypothetical protein